MSTPGSTPYFSYEAFAALKHYTPFYAQDFLRGGLCKWWAPTVLPRTSVLRLLRVWSIIPLFYAQDFRPGGLCKWCAPPVLPRTLVMRLLEVWSIIPLFVHKISSRVVCVNGEHPRFYPVLQLWGFCVFEVLYPFLCTRFPPGWFVSMVSTPRFYPVLQLWGFCGFEALYPFLCARFPPGWFV